jgi:hypothetical protein
MARTRSLVRHTDGDSEFVVDTRRLPLVVTTWFGSPTLGLVEAYARWLQGFIERSTIVGRKVVLIDDATLAERPSPPVRGRLAQIECPPTVILDRLVVVNNSVIRGAITALSWSTGRTIATVETIETGVSESRRIFAEHSVEPPREFEIEPAQRSTSS